MSGVLCATWLLAALNIYLSVRLSVRLSVCLSLCPSICLSVYLFVCLSVCLSICLSVYLSVCALSSLSYCRAVGLYSRRCVLYMAAAFSPYRQTRLPLSTSHGSDDEYEEWHLCLCPPSLPPHSCSPRGHEVGLHHMTHLVTQPYRLFAFIREDCRTRQ